MTVTPTPETNLELIEQLQQLVSSAAEPPSGAEFSYPVVDQAVSANMWRWITRGVGNGVLYAGGQPYAIGNINNNAQTVQILVSTRHGTANAIVDGFFHQLSENKTFNLPMPGSGSITYTIALTFDPRRENDQAGPISLELYTGTPPLTFDRKHVVLHRVTRRANELLSDATFENAPSGISPLINANNENQLPDPETVLSGTICVTSPLTRPEFWFARHWGSPGRNEWVSLTSPEWQDLSLYTAYKATSSGVSPQLQRTGKTRRLRGRVNRIDGQTLTTGWADGWNIGRLDVGDRPRGGAHRQPVSGWGVSPSRVAVLDIDSDGYLYVRSTGQTMQWISLDGVSWDVA